MERVEPPPGLDQFVEDEEEAEGIDRPGVEIVVAVFRIVEMEAAELPGIDQPRDDLLDVDVRRVVPESTRQKALGPSSIAVIRLVPQSAITVE